jgi:HSP20 family protein
MTPVLFRNRYGLVPWNPLRDVEDRFGRLFADLAPTPEGGHRDWTPSVDVSETEDAYVIEADLPGLDKKDIELSVHDTVVTIKGERKSEKEEKGDKYHRIERSHGVFQRSFNLAGGFDGEKVEADFRNGVLRVTLPKREEAKPKQIDVQVK